MSFKQVKWAQQHDWFIKAKFGVNGYIVIVRDDMDADKTIEFDDFQKLREWAGY